MHSWNTDARLGKKNCTVYLSKFQELPKGIDKLTLEKVQQVLSSAQISGLTFEEVASQIGASRTTFRRYLEYLVSQMILDVDIRYWAVGLPKRRYFRNKHWSVFLNCILKFL